MNSVGYLRAPGGPCVKAAAPACPYIAREGYSVTTSSGASEETGCGVGCQVCLTGFRWHDAEGMAASVSDQDGRYGTQRVKRSGSSTAKRRRVPATQIAISEVMADGAPRRPSEIAEILGVSRGAASAAMGRMARAGVLVRLGRGQYQRENLELLHPAPR